MHTCIRLGIWAFMVVWISCGSPSGTPQSNGQSAGEARISWDDTLADLGTLKEGTEVEHTFTFKNTGNTDVVIQQAIPSCGCTIASIPDKPVHPAQQGHVVVHFRTAGQLGEQIKQITIVCNAHPAKQYLYLKARIIQQ